MKKFISFSLTLLILAGMLTGCSTPESKQTNAGTSEHATIMTTEPTTEPPTEPETEKPTEKQTEVPTEKPTEKATEKPTEKPTVKKTPPITENPTEKKVTAKVESLTSPVSRNEIATLKFKGASNTKYNIEYILSSGKSKADVLEPKTSDSNGYITCSWKIGGKTNPGTYNINIVNTSTNEKTTYQIVVE